MHRLKPILFIAILTILTVSCGQKGPLFLPAEEPTPVGEQNSEPKEAEEKEKEKDDGTE